MEPATQAYLSEASLLPHFPCLLLKQFPLITVSQLRGVCHIQRLLDLHGLCRSHHVLAGLAVSLTHGCTGNRGSQHCTGNGNVTTLHWEQGVTTAARGMGMSQRCTGNGNVTTLHEKWECHNAALGLGGVTTLNG